MGQHSWISLLPVPGISEVFFSLHTPPVRRALHWCCWRNKGEVQENLTFHLALNWSLDPPHPAPVQLQQQQKCFQRMDPTGSLCRIINAQAEPESAHDHHSWGKDGRALWGAPNSPCQVNLCWDGRQDPHWKGDRCARTTLYNLLLHLMSAGVAEAGRREIPLLIRNSLQIALWKMFNWN